MWTVHVKHCLSNLYYLGRVSIWSEKTTSLGCTLMVTARIAWILAAEVRGSKCYPSPPPAAAAVAII
jgi:hypothetical protein